MGGEGFSNPVTNNIGTLVRSALRSENYVAGVSGWRITRTGSAEFNDGTFRGGVIVGVSPNPRIELTTTIPAVLQNNDPDFEWTSVILQWFNATDFVWDAVGWYNNPTSHIFQIRGRGSYRSGIGVNYDEFYQNTGSVSALLYGSNSYNPNPMTWSYRNGSLYAVSANFLTDAVEYTGTDGGTAEGWQAMSLQNSWANFGGAFVTANYRHIASPPRSIQLVGVVSGGTATAGTVLANLPAGYRPTTRQRALLYAFGGTMSIVTEPPALDLATNGDLSLVGTTNATILAMNITYALDI